MILVMTLLYLGCVLAAFKIIKLKVTPVSVGVSALIGVLLLGGIVTLWKLASPMSGQLTLRRPVARINPDLREFVSKVHVESNQLVSKGEPLFEISRTRFAYAVDAATASLASARSKVSQLEASVTAAEATIQKAEADTGVAKAEIDTARRLKRSSAGAVSKLKIAEAQAAYQAALANTQTTQASLQQTKAELAAATFAVEVAQAALDTAQFNLSQTTYRSPVDGRVINFQVREGTPVTRWQAFSVGTIMDLSDTAVLAVYPQNLLRNVAAGDSVEVAFRRQPGLIASGKVQSVINYTGEGQFKATARLPVVATVGSKGFLAVRIILDDEELAKTLPLGADGTAAIYTGFGKPFQIISKIALRIKGWLYYLPV
jgi:membrane fusion protein (multidrug efflux system)